jgi:hypothetical protein
MYRSCNLTTAGPTLVLFSVLALMCPESLGQTKPFKVVGEGVGPNGLPLPGQPPRAHWSNDPVSYAWQGQGQLKFPQR